MTACLIGRDIAEKDFLAERRTRWNDKEAGQGDKWEEIWFSDRRKRCEPNFKRAFEKWSRLSVNDTSLHTLIINITRIEPGWDVGAVGKAAFIEGEAIVVRTGDSAVLSKILFVDQRGRNAFGGDFEMGLRIQEAYVAAGSALGAFIQKKIKK